MTNALPLAYLLIVAGVIFNLITVFMLKKAEGFTVLWPSVIALVCVCITQVFVARAITAGLDLGMAVTLTVVAVMVGSFIIGAFFFQEAVSAQKIFGFSLAVAGVAIASLAKQA